MNKIIVTGANGFLGGRIARHYKDQFEVIGLTRQDCNLSDPGEVQALFSKEKPDVLIHCAAVSDIGYAAVHVEESFLSNVLAPVCIAHCCAKAGVKLVYMSSDQVYAGYEKKGLLGEKLILQPSNVYGEQKWTMEQEVQKILPDAVGLRLTWMYDLPCKGLKTNSNLIWNILNAIRRREVIVFRDKEYRSVTYVWEVVEKMEAITHLPGGIYNCGSENDGTTYDLAQYAHQLLRNPDSENVIRCESGNGEFRNLSIDMSRMRQNGIFFESAKEGILRCLMEYGYVD